ncbi:MAG: glycerol-3-phosphate 1-O-acyltransferase PlsY [Phycisphaeraceae bacterium]|nr:glycerol-3-phosphate 1-O-acyltransferase PlsY [Phycisphaeraceae bacterium]
MELAAIIALSYLAGSVPFGLLLARIRGVDIRAHGSGNIGATNVWRVLGWRLGLTCFVLDVLKGLAPALIAGAWLGVINNPAAEPGRVLVWLAAPVSAIAGHLFPIWLRFKGGKGVATGLGAMLGVFPVLSIAAVGALAVWIVSAKLTRMVGISSCFAAIALPLIVLAQRWVPASWRAMVAGDAHGHASPALWPYLAVTIPLALVVIIKHRANIARTLAGTENRIGARR